MGQARGARRLVQFLDRMAGMSDFDCPALLAERSFPTAPHGFGMEIGDDNPPRHSRQFREPRGQMRGIAQGETAECQIEGVGLYRQALHICDDTAACQRWFGGSDGKHFAGQIDSEYAGSAQCKRLHPTARTAADVENSSAAVSREKSGKHSRFERQQRIRSLLVTGSPRAVTFSRSDLYQMLSQRGLRSATNFCAQPSSKGAAYNPDA